MAEQVDALASIKIDDDGTREFLDVFFSCETNAKSSVLHIDKTPPKRRHIQQAAHILFRYKLLDIMACTLNVPPHQDLQVVPPTPPPTLTVEQLNRVWIHLSSIFSLFP